MENAVIIQKLEAQGIDVSVLFEGLLQGDEGPRVAFAYPESRPLIEAAAAQVTQNEQMREQQNTIAAVGSLLGVTSGQVELELQTMSPNLVYVLAVEALSGDEAVREHARLLLGLPPEPEPTFGDDEVESSTGRFHNLVATSEIVLDAPKLARHQGWRAELLALSALFAASESVIETAPEPRAQRAEDRPAPVGLLRALNAVIHDPAPNIPRPSARGVIESETLENDD